MFAIPVITPTFGIITEQKTYYATLTLKPENYLQPQKVFLVTLRLID